MSIRDSEESPATLTQTLHEALPGRPCSASTLTDRSGGSIVGAPPTPRDVPDYEPVRLIGRGGFGHVWLARQKLTGVFCALKFIPRSHAGDVELDGVRSSRQHAARLPHLVRVEHVGETGEGYYYVMELADDARGEGVRSPEGYEPWTLAEELKRRGRIPVGEAAGIAIQILEGIEELHRMGLLHRDVKPANVLRRGGSWALGDVGLVSRSATAGGYRAYTPAYAPPGGILDRSGDLYSIGVLLTEMTTGSILKGPLGSSTFEPFAHRKSARVLASAVARACDPVAQRRFQSADEMRRALTGLAERGSGRTWGLSIMLGSRRLSFMFTCTVLFLGVGVVAVSMLGERVCGTFSNVQSSFDSTGLPRSPPMPPKPIPSPTPTTRPATSQPVADEESADVPQSTATQATRPAEGESGSP